MARLGPLIKVRRHALEVAQRALAVLLREEEALEAAQVRVVAERAVERAGAAQAQEIESLVALARYEAGCAAALEDIAARVAALAPRIVRAREVVREAFAETKKVEIVAEHRAAADKARLAKAQGAALDEVGIEAHRRKGEPTEASA